MFLKGGFFLRLAAEGRLYGVLCLAGALVCLAVGWWQSEVGWTLMALPVGAIGLLFCAMSCLFRWLDTRFERRAWDD